MSARDGGPAFPRIDGIEPTGFGGCQSVIVSGGMSLRDYFAAHALEEDVEAWRYKLANTDAEGMIIPASREAGRFAYADAMLAERSK